MQDILHKLRMAVRKGDWILLLLCIITTAFGCLVISSATQYLNSFRIQRAKKLLVNEDLSIKEVAHAVGIPDPDYFCRVFQKHSAGVSPTQYRTNQ